MWPFNKKSEQPKIEIFKPRPPRFDISNSNHSSYDLKMTLKPLHACYYASANSSELTEFILPRFVHYQYDNHYDNRVPVSQARAIKLEHEYDKKVKKEPWCYKTIYVVQEELERYYTFAGFELTLRRFRKKNESEDFEKLELCSSDFRTDYCWFQDDFSDITCAQLYDFYINMDEDIIKAFGNGLFESLKVYKELIKEGSISDECVNEIVNYISQIYNTALSMGEFLEPFPTIPDYINIHNEEELKKKEAELERKRQLAEKQAQFIHDLKIRQSLLDDFNRPFSHN